VHLVGFVIKRFVTMHGHMNVTIKGVYIIPFRTQSVSAPALVHREIVG